MNLRKVLYPFTKKNVCIKPERIEAIEKCTIDQSHATYWAEERRQRITASDFASIIKKREKTSCQGIVKRKLYSSFKGNALTRRGLSEEDNSILEYRLFKSNLGTTVNVQKAGLTISQTHPYLGASPDGKVNVIENQKTIDTGLLEIKQVLLTHHGVTLMEAAKNKKVNNFCLKLNNSQLMLKFK